MQTPVLILKAFIKNQNTFQVLVFCLGPAALSEAYFSPYYTHFQEVIPKWNINHGIASSLFLSVYLTRQFRMKQYLTVLRSHPIILFRQSVYLISKSFPSEIIHSFTKRKAEEKEKKKGHLVEQVTLDLKFKLQVGCRDYFKKIK